MGAEASVLGLQSAWGSHTQNAFLDVMTPSPQPLRDQGSNPSLSAKTSFGLSSLEAWREGGNQGMGDSESFIYSLCLALLVRQLTWSVYQEEMSCPLCMSRHCGKHGSGNFPQVPR